MPRTRDIVALSAILVAPLVATLIVTRSSHDDTAPVAAEPTPVVAVVEPPRVEPATVEPPKVETPPAPPPVEPPTPATEDKPAEPALERDPGQLMLVVDNDLVLHTGPDVAWSSGKLNIVARSARLSVSKKADLDKLPAPVRAAASSTVTVYGSDGGACVATVGAVRVDVTQTGEAYMGLDVPEGESLISRVHASFESVSAGWVRAESLSLDQALTKADRSLYDSKGRRKTGRTVAGLP